MEDSTSAAVIIAIPIPAAASTADTQSPFFTTLTPTISTLLYSFRHHSLTYSFGPSFNTYMNPAK